MHYEFSLPGPRRAAGVGGRILECRWVGRLGISPTPPSFIKRSRTLRLVSGYADRSSLYDLVRIYRNVTGHLLQVYDNTTSQRLPYSLNETMIMASQVSSSRTLSGSYNCDNKLLVPNSGSFGRSLANTGLNKRVGRGRILLCLPRKK